ncbi:MAG: PQQ-dependent sugar dehydrogenase [Blastocatellia bacterium]
MPTARLKLLLLLLCCPLMAGLALMACNTAPQPAANVATTAAALPRIIERARTPEPRVITPEDLPKPFATEAVGNPPTVVDKMPDNATLEVPPGFDVTEFAAGGDFKRPRNFTEAPNGDILVSDSGANNIVLLRDANKDGKIDNATERHVFVEGLTRPYGMAFHGDWFYVGNNNSVVRFKYEAGATKISAPAQKIADLPADQERGHWTRNLLFSPDGKKLYVSIGSVSNIEAGEAPQRATICELDPETGKHTIYGSGIRNPVGLAWNPVNNDLWTCVNERDGLGDDLVPDYATSVKKGGFYGWPYSYLGQNVDPRREKDQKPDLVKRAIVPDVLIEAHGAAIGLVFYTGNMFPEEYKNDAFVALHGSWNRSKRHGYKIIHIPFKDGKPEGGYRDFLTGFAPDLAAKEVWGRPAGLLARSDGSLLIADDGGKKIWRVSYRKP